MPYVRLPHSRTIGFRDTLSDAEIETLARLPDLEALQTSTPIPDGSVWQRLDANLFKRRPEVLLRLYGFYGETCDLGFAAQLKNVRRFAADCLMKAVRVEAIADVGVLAELPALQSAHLESLKHVAELPELRRARTLRRLHLQNLKALKDLSPLRNAPAIEELVVIDSPHLQPEALLPALENPSLRRLAAFLGTDKKNQRIRALREQHGIAELTLAEPFDYRP